MRRLDDSYQVDGIADWRKKHVFYDVFCLGE